MEDGSQEVGEWLEAQQLADKPRLLEQMQVDDGWQLAVETVLGDYLQAVCVEDIGKLGAYLGSLEQGRLLLLEPAVSEEAAAGDLASKVQSGGHAGALLAGVRAAEDLEQAMQPAGNAGTTRIHYHSRGYLGGQQLVARSAVVQIRRAASSSAVRNWRHWTRNSASSRLTKRN